MAKPVIISSQFLESMIHAPMPLRAEMTDIHSAVMDGADGLMLVSETSIGKFPVEAIKVVNDVCIAAEQHFRYQEHFTDMLSNAEKPLNKLEAMANSSVKSAFNLQSPIILTFSDTGRIVRLLSKYRPYALIVIVTENMFLARQAALIRSCQGIYVGSLQNMNEITNRAMAMLKRNNYVRSGNDVIYISGIAEKEINCRYQMKLLEV